MCSSAETDSSCSPQNCNCSVFARLSLPCFFLFRRPTLFVVVFNLFGRMKACQCRRARVGRVTVVLFGLPHGREAEEPLNNCWSLVQRAELMLSELHRCSELCTSGPTCSFKQVLATACSRRKRLSKLGRYKLQNPKSFFFFH